MDEHQPCEQLSELNLGDLSASVLEEVLADLMIAKYPGIEQEDINCLLAALRNGDLGLIEQIEADIAEKSAHWMRAVLDIED